MLALQLIELKSESLIVASDAFRETTVRHRTETKPGINIVGIVKSLVIALTFSNLTG